MYTYEFKCRDQHGRDQKIHVTAPDEGEAMIEFRNCESFVDWTVRSINQIIATSVIEEVDTLQE